MIQVEELTKRYGAKTAVRRPQLRGPTRHGHRVPRPERRREVHDHADDPGAGSTYLRANARLRAPVRGASRRAPARRCAARRRRGPGDRRAFAHLHAAAATIGLGPDRVREVLAQVGLEDVASQRISAFSLGMRQRLGIALALLGDPPVVMLDEPINGLDPDGVIWVRHLLRSLADQGRTVFVSSHLMSEVAQTADHLVVIGRGRLVADVPTEELLQAGTPSVTVRAVEAATLASLLTAKGAGVERPAAELLEVRDLSAHDIAQIALDHRLLVHELTQHNRSLEEAFMDLTHADVEFQGADIAGGGPA